MSIRVYQIRSYYQQIRQLIYGNQIQKLTITTIKRYRDEALKQKKRLQNYQQFNNIQQVQFYRDKFEQLIKIMQQSSNNKTNGKQFNNKAKDIMKQKGFLHFNQQFLPNFNNSQVINQQAIQIGKLNTFFQSKRVNLSNVKFQSLLENPPINSKNFKKCKKSNSYEIQQLINQNQNLKRQLQKTQYGNRQQYKKNIDLLTQLGNENQKLKAKRRAGINSNFPDYLYYPYIINPQQNNLQAITNKTMYNDTFDQNPYIMKYQNNFTYRKRKTSNQDGSQSTDTNGNMNGFSMLDQLKLQRPKSSKQSKTFSRNSVSVGINDPQTVIRNKMAFFRNAGTIVQNYDIQIAYSRIISNDLKSNRVALYFINKSNRPKKINVDYSYESQYYMLQVAKKAEDIPARAQAKELVEVILNGSKQDVNSLIQANVKVDGQLYTIWLPTMFIIFTYKQTRSVGSVDNKIKMANWCQLFQNSKETQKIIPQFIIKRPGEGDLWIKSAVQEGLANLTWKNGNKLQIDTSQKWMDFMLFLMFEFR